MIYDFIDPKFSDDVMIDYGVSCATPAFYMGFAAGVTTLVVFSILIPLYLLKIDH